MLVQKTSSWKWKESVCVCEISIRYSFQKTKNFRLLFFGMIEVSKAVHNQRIATPLLSGRRFDAPVYLFIKITTSFHNTQ